MVLGTGNQVNLCQQEQEIIIIDIYQLYEYDSKIAHLESQSMQEEANKMKNSHKEQMRGVVSSKFKELCITRNTILCDIKSTIENARKVMEDIMNNLMVGGRSNN